MSTITFNLIYTPGTVQQLSFLVYSLVKWSDCTFRLVANGCPPEEAAELQAVAQSHPALDFLVLPTKHSMSHGQALNYLQAMTTGLYFCFMDSDIYAKGEFLPALTQHLPEYKGVFSCAPIKCKGDECILPAQRRAINGWHNQTQHGLCLGSSYFALYHNPTLSTLLQSTGIGFEACRWAEIPQRYQHQLEQLGVVRDIYDTGKVLNLLLLARGEKLIYQQVAALRHIGGVSRLHQEVKHRQLSQVVKRWGKRLLGRDTEQIWGKQLRKETEFYFFDLLQALRLQQPLPQPPLLTDSEIAATLHEVTQELVTLYREYAA